MEMTSALLKVIQEYKKEYGFNDEPMDGDDVEAMINEIREAINIHEGNV